MSDEKQNLEIAATSLGNEGKILEWTTHPIKKRPITAVLLTLFIAVIPLMVLSITSSKIFATLALVVLFASVAKFYFPTKFRLTEQDVSIKSSTQTIKKNWSEFRSFYPDKSGILLSPFIEPSRLENFRGIYLIFHENKDDVISFVKNHIAMDTENGEVV